MEVVLVMLFVFVIPLTLIVVTSLKWVSPSPEPLIDEVTPIRPVTVSLDVCSKPSVDLLNLTAGAQTKILELGATADEIKESVRARGEARLEERYPGVFGEEKSS